MNYKPYSIASPPYEICSGGIRVMYALRSWLEIKGQIALMNTQYDVPFVGIYPEIYHGNDLKADTVVRYILNTPGVMAGYGIPGPTTQQYKNEIEYQNNQFYIFSKIYDTFGVDDDHLLFIPVINTHIFKNYKKSRKKTCYLVGKGNNLQKHPTDSIELTRQFANNQSALSDLLNECEYLYGYDPLSAMYDIARLCGCKVKYYGGKTKEELKDYEPGLEGIDFNGDKDFFDIGIFRSNYLNLRKLMSQKIDRFIEDTQS